MQRTRVPGPWTVSKLIDLPNEAPSTERTWSLDADHDFGVAMESAHRRLIPQAGLAAQLTGLR
jgi:hypothetical protein